MRSILKKFLFIGPLTKKELFFAEAQKWGVIHFTSKKGDVCPYADTLQKGFTALKIIPKAGMETPFQPITVERALHLKERLAALDGERKQLAAELELASCFGVFSWEDLQGIECSTGLKAQFFWAAAGRIKGTKGLMLVNQDKKRDYFLALTHEPLSFPQLHRVPLEKLPRQAEVLKELHQVQLELQQLGSQRVGLEQYLVEQVNQASKGAAVRGATSTLDAQLFTVSGWVPEKECAELQKKVEPLKIYLLPIEKDLDETPPTFLQNNAIGQMGEDLVQIYDTPSAEDKDPSLWVLAFFALFFAFIIGDGGYGLLFLGGALFIRWKYTLAGGALRAWRIAATLSVACVFWGFLTHSFFGIPIPEDSVFRKYSLLQWAVDQKALYLGATNPAYADHVMLELALLIGVIHLSISLIRYAVRNPPAVGWLIFLWSATLYLPSYLKVDSLQQYIFHLPLSLASWGLYGMGVGMAFATIASLIKNGWLGLLEPTTLIQIFGDSMSYLRLYALALAGSMMTGAILELASTTNVVVAALIIVLGHLTNIVLAIMGGTIHGLRLNFLEWYHYSFEGGGKPYQPLRRIS